jgi:hypothetical protein
VEEKTMTLEIKTERRGLTLSPGSGEPAVPHEKAVEIVKEILRAEQIAEMAKALHQGLKPLQETYDTETIVAVLYDAGYRKQVGGEWILQQNGNGICSNCKRQDGIDDLASFCRYCGAKMKGGAE